MTRRAMLADLPALLQLYRHLHPDDPPPSPAAARAAWAAMQAAGVATFVAEHAGSLVASCALAVVPNLTRSARPYGVIENVVTHPDHRRAGWGLAVLAAAVDAAWAAGCYKVMLATGSKEPGTLRFYERAGFVRGTKTAFDRRP